MESKRAASTTYFQVPFVEILCKGLDEHPEVSGGMRCCDLKIGSGEEVAEHLGERTCKDSVGTWQAGSFQAFMYSAFWGSHKWCHSRHAARKGWLVCIHFEGVVSQNASIRGGHRVTG